MKKLLLWIVMLILSISMIAAFSFAGCKAKAAAEEEAVEEAPAEEAAEEAAAPVKITHLTSWVGEHVFAEYFKNEMERFNSEYGNEVEVVLEEIPDAEREDKLKVLLSGGDLPDVFTTTGLDVIKIAADAGLLVDLKPYLDNDPEWMASLSKNNLD